MNGQQDQVQNSLEDHKLRRIALYVVLALSMVSIAVPGIVSLLLVSLVGKDVELDLPDHWLPFFNTLSDLLDQIDTAPFKYVVTVWYSVPAILTAVVLGTKSAWKIRSLKFSMAGLLVTTLLVSLYPLFVFEGTTVSDWSSVTNGVALYSRLPGLTNTAFQLCISYLALLTGLQIMLGEKGELR